MTITVHVEGLKELREAMLKLPKELREKHLGRAVNAAAKVVQRAGMERMPIAARARKVDGKVIQPGTLRRAVYRTRSKEGSSAVQEMRIVGVRAGKRFRRRGMDAWYWRFLEFGTSKIPAMAPLRKAFDASQSQALQAMVTSLRAGLERAVQAVRHKGGG